ncbi:MAG: transcription elongation factor GreA [Alkalibacterium sp.]|uniref:Transcription elongation factor GreA n=1 Tax=Alkalibacterium gilvum TaxID=1130080 RepID=A0A1H6UEI5_9LACT|nr:transcription elongation factor GreA [Alkalibacterium sp.]MDN6295777.1 transcription elongation factor GreA [Alkalibacterium sp.]MDN6729887.1 transcription elongation factor GreA [Alkalibacterium sp.]SEI88087.1 transcription elongation factor GreA [Alkalibacterium gilvum]HAJ70247.1 transcription elongation factor GreA [Alkalibacterium sp.]
MVTEKVYPMTIQGKEKLEKELTELKSVKRKEVVERIKIARGFGDLSENSEYESAKDEQAFIEGRISTLENMLQNAEIIDSSKSKKGEVTLGRTVIFKELPDGILEEYTIVGKAEADPFSGKISNESPIAQALLNKKVGDKVDIETPGGKMQVEITKVV